MAGFNNIYITTAGAVLAAKTLEGKQLKFSVAKLGSGTLSDSSMSAIKARTTMVNPVMTIDITKVEKTSNTQVTISFVFQNIKAGSAFYFRELGIFAIDPDTRQEVLFAYAYAGNNAEYVNNSVSEIVEKTINVVVTVDNASNVTINLDGSQIYVTEKELEEALKNSKSYDGKVYISERQITDNTISSFNRKGDSEGLEANATKNGSAVRNDYTTRYPWSHMRKCNVDPNTAKVLAYYGEVGYREDGTNGEVCIEIPDLYYLRERFPNEFKKVIEHYGIADYAKAGFKFNEKFYIGAYPMDIDSEGVGHSRSGVVPSYNKTKAQFRAAAKLCGEKVCLMDWRYFILQILYLVEYAHYNSQDKIGQGMTNFSAAKAIMAENNTNRIIVASAGTGLWVGKTVCIGATDAWNSSVAADREITAIEDYNDGTVSGKAIYFDGEPVNIVLNNTIWGSAQKNGEVDELGEESGCLINNGYHTQSYHGIQGLIGGLLEHIDGINIKDGQVYLCKDPSKYADDVFDGDYKPIGYVNAQINDSYSKTLGYDADNPEIAFPTEVGASSSTGTCDWYTYNTGNRIACAGGNFYNYGALAGLFYLHCSSTSGLSGWYCGARLLIHQ